MSKQTKTTEAKPQAAETAAPVETLAAGASPDAVSDADPARVFAPPPPVTARPLDFRPFLSALLDLLRDQRRTMPSQQQDLANAVLQAGDALQKDLDAMFESYEVWKRHSGSEG